MKRQRARHCLALFVGVLSANSALADTADQRGQAILSDVDRAVTRPKDEVSELEMIVGQGKKVLRRVGMRVHERGSDKRHTELLYPGDVRGMRVLVLSRTQMYVYLPAYKKVRRIASHVRAQSMFGADYTYDDMATLVFGDTYRARLLGETTSHWKLQLSRRPGVEGGYHRIVMQVRKDNHKPDHYLYFNRRGDKIKSEKHWDFTCRKEICVPQRMKMVDHTRNDHWTLLVRKKWQVDSGFAARIFSLRWLQRGR